MTSYDEILYKGHPFCQTHPDRLATIGRLFGMQPAPVDQCRVLEVGCADGGNLLPMAYALPGSEFVGIDLGERGIASGQEKAQSLRLTNVQLRVLDLMQAGASLGSFDYIIAHGVYSWVPPAVQDGLMALCRRSLNPHGIAFISHSVHPGAHIRTMVAEMLQFHARRFSEPQQQIEQARALLRFLASARTESDPYTVLLQDNLQSVAARDPHTVFHDELGECHPLYFWQFAERAAHHELQYLGESDFWEMQETAQGPEVAQALRSLARNLIDKEQYMDFVKCRRFRQTLLCGADVPLNRRLESAQMRQFFIAAVRQQDLPRTPTEHPLALAAMAILVEAWPAAMTFDELLAAVRSRVSGYPDDDLLLADTILAFYACGLFQLHVHPPRVKTEPGERPRTSAIARMQAPQDAYVTNLCHNVVVMEDELSRRLLAALDGARDRDALLADLRASGAQVDAEELDRALNGLAKVALLEA